MVFRLVASLASLVPGPLWKISALRHTGGRRTTRLSKATRERLDGVGLLDMTFVSEVAAEGAEELAKIFTPYLGMPNDEANDWAAFFEVTEVARRSVVKRRCLHVRAPQHALASLSFRLQFDAAEMGFVARTSLTLPLAPCALVAKWPTRLRWQLAVTEDPREQQRLEEKDRDRWVRAACGILIEDCYPVAELAAGAGDGHIYLKHVFGGRRARTLRLRVRLWQRVRGWLRASGRCLRPCGEELAKGQCLRTQPLAVISALNLFETTGGVKTEDRIATNALVTSTVADLDRELGMGALRPRRKAPHYPVSIVAAFEDQVCNVNLPEYKRIYAWWKLVLVWGCMRYDDITEDRDSVCFPLTSTKTTGAGRRVVIIFAHVSRKAALRHRDWLEVGWKLMEQVAGHIARDYLLPLASSDFRGVRRGPARYHDALNMTRALLQEVECDGVKLFSSMAAMYWSQHGDRAQLVSWAACIGVQKTMLDALGRWRAGSISEYIRTSKRLVIDAQNAVAKAIKEYEGNDDVFGEEVVFDGLAAHLKAKGVDGDSVRAQVGRLRSFAPSCIRMVPSEVKEVDVQEEGFEVEQARQHKVKGPYVVSMSMRTGVRCLHLVGGCWRQPGVTYFKYEDLGPIADASYYYRVCKQCWQGVFKGTAAEAEEKEGNESEEESSSSSSSSGSSTVRTSPSAPRSSAMVAASLSRS